MTDPVLEDAPAKVNLHLAILALEPDGYHSLDTIFQSVDFHDTVEAHPAEGDDDSLEVVGSIDTGSPSGNLVLKAAQAYRAAAPETPPVRFVLHKRIPAGAGLGGGSSDAAAALRALDRLARRPLGGRHLARLGAALGADVAFFLCGSPLARAGGRGDRLTPLPPLPAASVLIVDPGFPIATRDAFRWWDERSPRPRSEPAPARPFESFQSIARFARNDFEDVVFDRHPALEQVRGMLLDHGARIALLSGSGSCVFGLWDDGDRIDGAAAAIEAAISGARALPTRTRTSDRADARSN